MIIQTSKSDMELRTFALKELLILFQKYENNINICDFHSVLSYMKEYNKEFILFKYGKDSFTEVEIKNIDNKD